MRIKNMFQKDIDREINGVVKVAEDGEADLKQELTEYVVTSELAEHFKMFFDAYEHALRSPTDDTGVWISGFFGSGKSHFLKILSTMLRNKPVAGKPTIEYFADKFEERTLYEQAVRCASIPTESILFNIDNKGPAEKGPDAIKQTFAAVFDEHRGYFGKEPRLARLEQYIDASGKAKLFQDKFEQITGETWLEARETSFLFSPEDIAEALADTGIMSEAAADRYLNDEEFAKQNIDRITDEIVAYAKNRSQEAGGVFRLLFMVDEMGQYINNGENTDLMLNLQTIAEELGRKGKGLVWIMVTSQEAIDQVVSVAGTGDDFSKIQGRFATRLSLSSVSVDEVIRRRLLEKTPDASLLLKAEYANQDAALKNLLHFKNATSDLTGYRDADDFASTFPFVSYQFPLMQRAFEAIRKNGSSGRHLSGRERSMLSGFQEAAQAVEDCDEHTLVPFWRFYDTTQTFLESHIRSAVTSAATMAANGQGLEPFDVEVLKALFLIRWVDEIESNIDNIAILMIDDMRCDLITLRAKASAALDRLVKEHKVNRRGETYQFLTNDEQKIARDISRTVVDPAKITRRISELVFGDILTESRLPYGENNFAIRRYIDDMVYGNASTDGLTLRIITPSSSANDIEHAQLQLRSQTGEEAICLLSADAPYLRLLQEAERVNRYAETVNHAILNQNEERIIQDRRADASRMLGEAKDMLEDAIRSATFYVQGSVVHPQGSSARLMLLDALSRLVDTTYPRLGLIGVNYHSDSELLEILRGERRTVDGSYSNANACDEMKRFLKIQEDLGIDTTMLAVQERFQKKPYGWREIDVAAVAAELLAHHDARLVYLESPFDITNGRCPNLLRKANDTRRAIIKLRVAVSDRTKNRARTIAIEFTGMRDLPQEETELTRQIHAAFNDKRSQLSALLDNEYRQTQYPGRMTIEHAMALIDQILDAGPEPSDVLPLVVSLDDELGDAAEQLEPVLKFFPHQQALWDSALDLMRKLGVDREELGSDENAVHNVAVIEAIMQSDSPYRRINELSAATSSLQGTHNSMLRERRNGLLDEIETIYQLISDEAQAADAHIDGAIGQRKQERQGQVHDAQTLSALDALSTRLTRDQADFHQQIEDAVARRRPVSTPEPPRQNTVSIRRDRLLMPATIRTAEDIDRYLEGARTALLAKLAEADVINIQ